MRCLFLRFFQYYVTLIAAASVLPKRNIRNISPLRTGLNMHKFAQNYTPLEVKRERLSATSYENLPVRRSSRDLEKLFDKNGVIYLGSLNKVVPEFNAFENQGFSRETQDAKKLFDKNVVILYLPSSKIVPTFKMSKKPRQEAFGQHLKANPDMNYLFKVTNDDDTRKEEENNAIAALLKALRFDKRQPKTMFEFSELVA